MFNCSDAIFIAPLIKIIYKEGIMPGAYITPLDYNDGTLPKAQSLITVLTLVDLRQDIWKKAFPDVK